MAWKKATPELIELLEEILPKDPRAERRKMFGYPCSFVNGNLWIGLHEHNLLLRLREQDRIEFLKQPEARPFEPMPGRPMREYVVAPQDLLEEPALLRRWVKRAFDYALSLPVKSLKAKARQPGKAPAKPAAPKAKARPTPKAGARLAKKKAVSRRSG
ncbi:MAG: TfoX/Sxy family protein [Polyangiaceae bacterium]|nr:TfoX/Sxy family protein [Polyangiaceae bacterium]